MDDVLDTQLLSVITDNYQGDIDEGSGLYEGYGESTFTDGSVYEGDFSKGLFDGQGRFTWPDKSSYEGSFIRGVIEGKGKIFWSNGNKYEGDFKGGKRHGNGVFVCADGQTYDGEWVDGLRHGKGKLHYNAEKSILYVGQWQYGMRDGLGIMRYATGNTYDGEWKADRKSGRGVLVWKDVDELYIGEWLDDQPHGLGEYIWSDTSNKPSFKRHLCNMYRGEWVGGNRSGVGSFFYADGSQYSGEWLNNQKDGSGTFIYPDGKIHYGFYAADRMLLVDNAPRESEAVNPQVRINISDLIEKLDPTTTAEKIAAITNTIERLLLRFNSSVRGMYKKYLELAHSRRKKETDTASESWGRVDKLFITSRNIHKRFFLTTLGEFWRFAREFSIITPHFNAHSVAQVLKQQRSNKRLTARSLQIHQEETVLRLQREAIEAAEAQAAAALLAAQTTTKKPRKVNSVSALPPPPNADKAGRNKTAVTAAAAAAKPNKTIAETNTGSASTSKTAVLIPVSTAPALSMAPLIASRAAFVDDLYCSSVCSVEYSQNDDIVLDPRFPLREYEFLELFVRCAVESQRLSEVISGDGVQQPADAADIVYRALSDKIQSRVSDWALVPEATANFYSPAIQLVIAKNSSKLQSIWSSIAGEQSHSCPFNAFIKYVLSLRECGVVRSDATTKNIMETLGILSAPNPADSSSSQVAADFNRLTTISSLRVVFDDFLYSMVLIISSDIWTGDSAVNSISGSEEQKPNESNELLEHKLRRRLSDWLGAQP